MFARTPKEIRHELERQTRSLLISRCRAGLWMLLVSDCLFAIGDVRLASRQVTPLLAFKMVQAGFIAFGFIRLRGRPRIEQVLVTALLVAGSNSILSSAVAIVRGDLSTLSLVFITLSMATATLLPWGAGAQAGLSVISGASAVWAVHEVHGSFAPLADHAWIAMAVAFGVSIYVAWVLDRYRIAVEERNVELRGYREVVENANDAILTLDSSGCLTGANPAAGAIFGADAAELIGRSLGDLLVEEEVRTLRRRASTLFSGSTREAILSLHARRDDGAVVPIEVKARPLGAGGVQAIVRDVSERRAVERVRNDFVAMLSHDIKTPLASILGFSEMLQDHLADTPDLRRFVDRIEANARVAHSLAVNFVDVARIENGSLELQLEKTSLNEIVGGVLHHQESMARAREISLEAALAADVPLLPLDRRHIDRVVSNLVSNAIKYSPVRSRVRIGTGCDGGSIVLTVHDEGPGIPQSEIPNLFRRYHRCENIRSEGSGLGLYIVKQIVEAHGGRVAVDCPLGGGSVFRIWFDRPDAAGEMRRVE